MQTKSTAPCVLLSTRHMCVICIYIYVYIYIHVFFSCRFVNICIYICVHIHSPTKGRKGGCRGRKSCRSHGPIFSRSGRWGLTGGDGTVQGDDVRQLPHGELRRPRGPVAFLRPVGPMMRITQKIPIISMALIKSI